MMLTMQEDDLAERVEEYMIGGLPKTVSFTLVADLWKEVQFCGRTLSRERKSHALGADDKAIFASYSEDLGVRANSDLQRIYDSHRYRSCFYATQIASGANKRVRGPLQAQLRPARIHRVGRLVSQHH
jgi:hypothetical protein